MFKASNFVVGVANTLVMLVATSAISYAIYMFVHQGVTNCEAVIRTPFLTIGLILFVVSLVGLIGYCFKKENFFMDLYLITLFVIIVSLMIFTIFLFFVTNKGAGRVVSGRGYYTTMDFSKWLNGFVGGKRWVGIKACLVDSGVCRDFTDGRLKPHMTDEFYRNHMSPIQSGCCKPPLDCKEFRNATLLITPTRNNETVAASNGDCGAWKNVKTELCYNCNTCKAGVLSSIRQKWRHLVFFNICLIILLIGVLSFGFFARRNSQMEGTCDCS